MAHFTSSQIPANSNGTHEKIPQAARTIADSYRQSPQTDCEKCKLKLYHIIIIIRTSNFGIFFQQATSLQGAGDQASEQTKQPQSLDAADANAIEEVNLAYENVKEVECLDITREGNEAWDAAVRRYEDRIGKSDLY